MPSTTANRLVFVPGLGTSSRSYRPLLRQLSHHYEVVVAEYPRPLPQRITWPAMLQALASLATDQTVSILGHSLGGSLALRFAAENPAAYRRVVAVAPVLFPFQASGEPWSRWRSLYQASRGAGWRHLWAVASDRRELLADPHTRQLYQWAGRIDLAAALATLHRVTVCQPVHEQLIPSEHFARLAAWPEITLRQVPGSHYSMALDPRPLVPVILESLDG